jgi:outer membrane immunogenic protein
MRTSGIMVSVAIAAAVVGTNAASATDLPAPVHTKAPVTVDAAYNWSGFYLGVHAGYFLGRSRVFDNGVLTESGAPTDGFAGGLLAGYNRQFGPVVLGLEGDFGWSNAQGHGTVVVPPPPPPLLPPGPNAYHLMWDSHFVGKAGFTSDRWLLFATGGVAVAGFSFQEGVPPGTPPSNRIPATYVGFSVGGGVEYAFTQNLLGRLQYIYDDFGGKSYTTADGGTYRVNLTSQTLRGGLSWKF